MRRVFIDVVIVLVAIAIWIPVFNGDFVLDDRRAIVLSKCVTGSFDPWTTVTTNFWCQSPEETSIATWRPVPVLLWWALWHIGGGSPIPFHLTNGLMHGACTALVISLGLSVGLSRTESVVAGLGFAVLPIHGDAVASIVGGADVLSTMFILVTIWGLLHGRWWLSVIAALGAVASKETGVVVAPLALLTCWIWSRKGKVCWVGVAVIVGLVIGAMGVRWVVLGTWDSGSISHVVNPLVGHPWWWRFPTAWVLVGHYVLLAVAPYALSVDYSYGSFVIDGRWLRLDVMLPMITAIMLSIGVWRANLPQWVWWAGLWCIGGLLLIAQIFVLFPVIFAERLFYGPSVPFCLLLAGGLGAGVDLSKRWIWVPMVVYAFTMGLVASSYAWVWTTEDRLTQAAQRASPMSYRANLWQARALLRQGRAVSAERAARAAIAILPTQGVAYAQLGLALDLQGRPEDALRAFQTGVRLDPRHAETADLLIQFLLKYGYRELAGQIYRIHQDAGGTLPNRYRLGPREIPRDESPAR